MDMDTTAVIQRHMSTSAHRARCAAAFELTKFPVEDVERILAQLTPETDDRNPCGRTSISLGESLSSWIRGKKTPYVKASWSDMEQSAQTGNALCVNRSGSFQLRPGGYFVVSHVWAETMGWHTERTWMPVQPAMRKLGMPLDQLHKFFDHCTLNVEWLWIDVLAMPEIFDDMTPADQDRTEHLRTQIINTLEKVYNNAVCAIVLDATLLRLQTRSLIDVAVILALSRWMTCLWCFTDAWLPPKVALQTSDSTWSLDEVLDFLYAMVTNDEHRYYNLFFRLSKLRPRAKWDNTYPATSPTKKQKEEDLLFYQIAHGCVNRCATPLADYARALFPVLGLSWSPGWTLADGVHHICTLPPEQVEWFNKYLCSRGLDKYVESVGPC